MGAETKEENTNGPTLYFPDLCTPSLYTEDELVPVFVVFALTGPTAKRGGKEN